MVPPLAVQAVARARMAAACRGTVAVAARPRSARQAASRWPSSVSNAVGALAYTAYRLPSFAAVTGFSPAPNSNFICSPATTSPADTPNPAVSRYP